MSEVIWTPTKYANPETEGWHLVTESIEDQAYVTEGYWVGYKWVMDPDELEYEMHFVTAWAEMPQPYREGA